MKIAGFQKQSLIDYPGNISSVVFTQGCNFRCGYCHNSQLVLSSQFGKVYDNDEIFAYLKQYKKLLDAVCVTGGEPTIQNNLPNFARKVKSFGLKVKLDTNGTNPNMLKLLLEKDLLDFVAMDIKHLLEHDYYNTTVGGGLSKELFDKVKASVRIIQTSEIEYEFRTTVCKGLHSKEDILSLKSQFASNYVIHNFNPDMVLNRKFAVEPFEENEFESL